MFGTGIDEPLVEYDAGGARTWLAADERGSVVARSNDAGAVTATNRYDEFGVPQGTNAGRFQYTGQMWMPELNAYYYKARVYAAAILVQLAVTLDSRPISFMLLGLGALALLSGAAYGVFRRLRR